MKSKSEIQKIIAEKDAIIKDLKNYIIGTHKYGIDSDTLKSRAEQYEREQIKK